LLSFSALLKKSRKRNKLNIRKCWRENKKTSRTNSFQSREEIVQRSLSVSGLLLCGRRRVDNKPRNMPSYGDYEDNDCCCCCCCCYSYLRYRYLLDWKVKQRLFFSGLLFFVFGKKRRYEMGKETRKSSSTNNPRVCQPSAVPFLFHC
jgi:hypothetical protein